MPDDPKPPLEKPAVPATPSFAAATPPKPPARPAAAHPSAKAPPLMIPLERIPARLRKVIETVDPRDWHRFRLLRVDHEEAIALADHVPALNHVLTVAPPKLIRRLRDGKVTPQAIDEGFRRIRDAISALKDAYLSVARMADVELRAARRDRNEADNPSPARPAAPPPPKAA